MKYVKSGEEDINTFKTLGFFIFFTITELPRYLSEILQQQVLLQQPFHSGKNIFDTG